MPENYYRTGQAAKRWGISSHQVRRLCEAGLIAAEFSGKQWMIPESEVNRIDREGVPPIPQSVDSDRQRVPDAGKGNGKGNGNHGLLAPPSEDVVEAAEDVAIAENRLKRRKIDRELEETEDWFRDREDREAQRIAAQEAAERERRAQVAVERQRRELADKWLPYAMNSVCDAPPEIQVDVHQAVEETLAKLSLPQPSDSSPVPTTPVGTLVGAICDLVQGQQRDSVIKQLVDAAIATASKPWRRRKEVERAIQEAADSLPFHAKGFSWNPSEWEIRAKQDAADAIDKLRDGASPEEMKAAARHAVQPIIKQFEHERACKEVLSWVPLKLHGETADDREQATTAAKAALEALPVGASQREREKARDAAIAPTQATIDKRREQGRVEEARRQDQEMRQDVLRAVSWKLPRGFPEEDKQEVLEAAQKALARLPAGTAQSELERARDKAIQPFLDAHAQREKKERLIEDGLRGIYAYIQKLEQDWEFDKSTYALEQEIKGPIREQLEEELSGSEPEEQVKNRVRRLVRQQLEL